MAEEGGARFGVEEAARVARLFDGETTSYADDLPALKAFARRAGRPVLELGCGSGRALVPLAKAGYEVTGVDLSPAMLAIARARAATEGVLGRVKLLEGDFSEIALGGPYRLAFIVMNTFLHLLSTAEQLRALRHWHTHLRAGALLVIDVFAPDVTELAGFSGKVEFDRSWPDPATGATVMKQVIRTVDQADQIAHLVMLYDEVGQDSVVRRTTVEFDLRYLWRAEAELLLRAAGFELIEIYGDWDLSPFDSRSERMILVAERV